MQVKLLRVIQESEISPVGGNANVSIDVRIICATKIHLKKRVEDKLFREDLFYRLNIVPIKIPPLRERKDDIPLLVDHFFKKHRAEDKIMLLTHDIYSALKGHDWPGNVRELENIVERMIALSFSGAIDLSVLDLSDKKRGMSTKENFGDYRSLDEFISKKEKEMLEWALEVCQNNVTGAAKLLNIPRTTLSSKIGRLLPHLKVR